MGLNGQMWITDYFKTDDKGIFGCKWMQDHFTQPKWSYLHQNTHYDRQLVMDILRKKTFRKHGIYSKFWLLTR